jgi:hypothetical protein
LEIKESKNVIPLRIEEIKTFDGGTDGLQELYVEQLVKLMEESKWVKSELDKHDVDEELVLSVRNIVSNIRKLNHEYNLAFQKAYDMTK